MVSMDLFSLTRTRSPGLVKVSVLCPASLPWETNSTIPVDQGRFKPFVNWMQCQTSSGETAAPRSRFWFHSDRPFWLGMSHV